MKNIITVVLKARTEDKIYLDMNQPTSSRVTVLSEAITDDYRKTNRYAIDMSNISTQDKAIVTKKDSILVDELTKTITNLIT